MHFAKIKLKINSQFPETFKSNPSEKRFKLFPDYAAGNEKIPDYFGRGKVADEIANSIISSEGQMNFLVSGEWGVGKTSILNLIAKNIKTAGLKYVWFSPWKYSGSKEEANAISRVFLTTLANTLGKSTVVRDLYIKKKIENDRNILAQLITLMQLILIYVLYFLVILLMMLAISPLITSLLTHNFNPFFKNIFSIFDNDKNIGIISSVLALPPFGQYFVSKIIEKGEIEKISSPELFEIKFKQLVGNTIKFRPIQLLISLWDETFQKTWFAFLGEPLTKFLYKLQFLKLDKLVIFIDDLDRCNKAEVTEFLGGIKTFLEHKKVYYVIAAHMTKLESKVSQEMEDEDPEFLRKIIQIDWNVPLLKKEEVSLFVDRLLDNAGMKTGDFTIKEIEEIKSILQLHPNPRKIKYYLRRLLFELNMERALSL